MKKIAGIILMLIGLVFVIGIVMDGIDKNFFSLLYSFIREPDKLSQAGIDIIVEVLFPNLIYGAGALGGGWDLLVSDD